MTSTDTVLPDTHVDHREVGGDLRCLHASPMYFLPNLGWILLGFATMAVPSPSGALLCLMALSLGWTASTVFVSGGPFLLPSSVMYLASSVFVGFACYYLVVLGSTTELSSLRVTAMIVYVATVMIDLVRSAFILRWGLTWPGPDRSRPRRFTGKPPRPFALKGVALILISRAPQLVVLNYELANAVGMVGVLMVVMSGLALRNRVRWGGDLVLILASLALPLFWTSLVFSGGGRLTVAGLAVAVAMIWNVVRPSRWFKVALLLAVPVAMLLGGMNRAQLIEEKYGVTDGTQLAKQGMYSVYDPLDRFATVVQEPDHPSGEKIGPRYGATFLNALMMPIPRSMWEGKPIGFGAEVTALMAPSMVRLGQSFSTLAFGEWYANFGWFGVAAMPLAFGWVVALIDRRHAAIVNEEQTTIDSWWRMVVLVCLVASMGDLYWGGTFTFFTRGGMAALVALMMWKFSTRRTSVTAAPSPVTPYRRRQTGAIPRTTSAAGGGR